MQSYHSNRGETGRTKRRAQRSSSSSGSGGSVHNIRDAGESTAHRERSQLPPRAALTAYNHCPSCLSHLVDSYGHEAIGSMEYDSTNNVFPDISDCELVEARQLVEELECSYLSDVELV